MNKDKVFGLDEVKCEVNWFNRSKDLNFLVRKQTKKQKGNGTFYDLDYMNDFTVLVATNCFLTSCLAGK